LQQKWTRKIRMKLITLNKEAFEKACDELIFKIDIQPDMVIGILNGGGYVVDVVKKREAFKSAQFESIKLQRFEKIKNKPVFKFLLKHLPYTILNKLREYESKKARESIASIDKNQLAEYKIDLKINSNLEKPIRTILIIDDAIDTGKTMYMIKLNLMKLFPEAKIKAAVISWTIESSIVKPDYYIFKRILVRYPWSKDYKGTDKF
jgi:hypoxanthine phosphoribosyltransferase